MVSRPEFDARAASLLPSCVVICPLRIAPLFENCRFPHVTSLNENDGRLRRSLKTSIATRLRECPSRLDGEPTVEPLHVHASIGCAATAAGAFIALCVLTTKVLT